MKTIAIVGRTNVGKSTLFNKLCHKKLAIVHDRPGVTRDRKEAEAIIGKTPVRLIDTAGLENLTSLAKAMWQQTQLAIAEADFIFAVVDGRSEISALDRQLAKDLHKTGKPVFLIVNKCETQNQTVNDFYQLGLGEPFPISAEHNLGIKELLATVEPLCKQKDSNEEKTSATRPLKLAIVGRPNVGKSTLINHFLQQERLLTGPEAGVTRDAITIPWTWQGKPILLTDTAGLRKYGKIDDELERICGYGTKNAIDFAEVVVLVLDATQPMERQDLAIASTVLQEGRALVIACNKWDIIKNRTETLKEIKEKMQTSLQQVKGIPVVPISGKSGLNLDLLLKNIFNVYELWNKRIPTHKLNTFLDEIKQAHPTPLARNGKRVPMKYMTQVNTRPPTFVIFTSNPDSLPDSYMRYISNGLRKTFGMEGVPIRIHLRKRENPYENKQQKPERKRKP
ncbi:MAG: ribosome biogenesis GTPase Der [Alphaproteobacteria bacterium]|nr:ribosome biogenesis GTPase Der [Alphaproteobacteria bacterium]